MAGPNPKAKLTGEFLRLRGSYDRERIAFLQAEAEKAGLATKAMADKYVAQMQRMAATAGVSANIRAVPTVTRGVTIYFIEYSVR